MKKKLNQWHDIKKKIDRFLGKNKKEPASWKPDENFRRNKDGRGNVRFIRKFSIVNSKQSRSPCFPSAMTSGKYMGYERDRIFSNILFAWLRYKLQWIKNKLRKSLDCSKFRKPPAISRFWKPALHIPLGGFTIPAIDRYFVRDAT